MPPRKYSIDFLWWWWWWWCLEDSWIAKMKIVNPSNMIESGVIPVKDHYQVSFRASMTRKLLKTADLFLWKNISYRSSASPDTNVALVVSDSLQPHQAPLCMGNSRQGYWSGLPLSLQGWSSWPRARTRVSYVSWIGRWVFFFQPLVPPGKP